MNNWHFRILNKLLRRFFYLLYNPMAWSYDLVATIVSAGMWQEWVLSVLPYLPGPKVLELGHGPGHLQKALLLQSNQLSNASPTQLHPIIIGLDISTNMGRLARRRLNKEKLSYQFIQGRSQQLPFPNDFFNQVTATFPSEYIHDPATIEEIARVLTNSGNAVILSQAQITGEKFYQRLAAWLFRVTGQAHEVDKIWREMVVKPFIEAGFETWIEEIIHPGSKIQAIIARKAKITSPNSE